MAEPLGKTWFKVNKWDAEPKPVTVTRSTTSRVWLLEKNWKGTPCFESKSSEYHDYFENLDDAVEHIRARLLLNIEKAKQEIESESIKLKALNEKYCGTSNHG